MSVVTYSLKKDWNKKLSKNFCAYEFACNDKSDKFLVSTELVEVLQQVRDHFGKPVQINLDGGKALIPDLSTARQWILLITFLLVAVLIASTALVLRLIFASRVLTRFVLHYTLLPCRILKAMVVLAIIAALK
mgnify:CR=1 FL=1